MHLDSLSNQQVDIENYNVSAIRLLTPTKYSEKLWQTQNLHNKIALKKTQ